MIADSYTMPKRMRGSSNDMISLAARAVMSLPLELIRLINSFMNTKFITHTRTREQRLGFKVGTYKVFKYISDVDLGDVSQGWAGTPKQVHENIRSAWDPPGPRRLLGSEWL